MSGASSFTAADDYLPPTTSARTIGKTEGGVAGFIRPGGSYRLYALAADSGNPASGVSTVKADLHLITSGQTAASLSSGSFPFDSVTYNRRSASLTAGSGLAEGTYAYSITLTDDDKNTTTESGYTVTVDDTVPTASNVQTTNKSGNVAGRPDQGDTIAFTFSEPPEPDSIASEWSGASTAVTVRIDNNQAAGSKDDQLSIYNSTNKTLLPLGTVDLGRTDYVTANRTFGASGTASTMVLGTNAITVTLGTQSGAGTTAEGNGALVWLPSKTATDWAGNAMSTSSLTESGASDKDF